MLDRWKDSIDSIREIDGDQNSCDGEGDSGGSCCLVYPESAVGDEDEEDLGDYVVDHVEVRLSLHYEKILQP